MTAASVPGVAFTVVDYGRKTRAEMVAQYRAYYEHQKTDAMEALAAADEDIVVETFLGPWAMRNREVVT